MTVQAPPPSRTRRSELPAWFARDRVNVAREAVRVKDPSPAEFAKYMASREPVVLAGAFARQPAIGRWTPDYLATQTGDIAWEMLASRNGRFPGGPWEGVDKSLYRATVRPLSECLRRISHKTEMPPIAWDEEKVYLYQIPLRLFGDAAADVRLPGYVPFDEATGRKFVWVGEAGNITPTHMDFEENVLVQVAGTKQLLLWDAAQYPHHYLYPFGTPHELHAQVDVTSPDMARFPDFARARAVFARIEPGDGVYIPFDYLHCVYSETQAISVNFWWGRNGAYRTKRWLDSPLRTFCLQTPVPFLKAVLRQRELEWLRRILRWPKATAYVD